MADRPVMILTDDRDQHADLVVQALAANGVPAFRADAAQFPRELTMTAHIDADTWVGAFTTRHRSVDLQAVRSVYYRRPNLFRFPEGMSAAETEYATAQARHGFGGVTMSLPCVWVNHPARTADAGLKPLQLQTARRVGFTVPPTLITNDPQAVRDFADQYGAVICKPLTQPGLIEHGTVKSVYTRLLTPADLDDLGGVRSTAHLFQAWVDKHHETRVTAVGQRLFAVEIYAGTDRGHLDWRTDYENLDYRPCSVPEHVAATIGRYLGEFGLTFGAFDFIVRPDGQWVFLECGPNSQWAWLVEVAGLPIHEAIADELAGAA